MYDRTSGSTNPVAPDCPSGLTARIEGLQKHAVVIAGQIDGIEAFLFGNRESKASAPPQAVPNGRIEELAVVDGRLEEICGRLQSIINALG